MFRSYTMAFLVTLAGPFVPSAALANGRMPGASQLKLTDTEPDRLVVQATFGILQSFDRGATWSWICEEVISTAGVAADPPLTTTRDGSIVLLPPIGATLVSHDRGCSWQHAGAPLADGRAADLTVDPSDASRVLVLLSTVSGLDGDGFAKYTNVLTESRDDARTWRALSQLPEDVALETVEIAGSDPNRVYVSGTASARPSLGVVLRSEDGGKQWTRSTLELPAGRGSMLISAVDPNDADRLWARVPARGDINGTLPTSLFVSDDKGVAWRPIAATKRGMFGFALSADGKALAYGGPGDGLFVGPSDGSGFEHVNDLAVTCLRWAGPDELYACAAEPPAAFSVGRSADRGRTFEPLYSLADTCPMTCADSATATTVCADAWLRVAPLVRASSLSCGPADAGVDAGSTSRPDARVEDMVAAKPHPRRTSSGCALAHREQQNGAWLIGLICAAVWLRRRERLASLALLAIALLACGSDAHEPDSHDAAVLDDDFRGCPEGYPSVVQGSSARSDDWTVSVLAALPAEPERNINSWTIEVTPADDVQITRGETFMPVHGHDGRVQPRPTQLGEAGSFRVDRLNFTMRGPWEVRLWLRSATREEQRVVFQVCVAK